MYRDLRGTLRGGRTKQPPQDNHARGQTGQGESNAGTAAGPKPAEHRGQPAEDRGIGAVVGAAGRRKLVAETGAGGEESQARLS